MRQPIITRDFSIDVLKGYLILFVVLGHLPIYLFDVPKASFNSFVEFIYLFHMPLFFSISVFFIRIEFKYIIKRIIYLFLIYLVWQILYNLDSVRNNSIGFLQHVLFGNWQHIRNVLWFLPALISLSIVYYLLNINKYLKMIILFLSFLSILFSGFVFTLHPLIPFGLDVSFYILPLALIMQWVYKKKNSINISFSLIILAILISSYIILHFNEKTQLHLVDLAQFSVINLISYPFFIILNLAIMALFFKISHLKYNIFFVVLGRYTLSIFLLHPLIQTFLYGFIIKKHFLDGYIKFLGNNFINYIYLFFIFTVSLFLPIVLQIIFNFFRKYLELLINKIDFMNIKRHNFNIVNIVEKASIFTVSFNWSLILAFVVFWSYSFIGSVFVGDSIQTNIWILVVSYIIFIGFAFLGAKNIKEFQDAIVIGKDDVYFLIPFILISIFVAHRFLVAPIIVDEIYHTQYAMRIIMTLVESLANKFSIFENIEYLQAIYVLSFILLSTFILCCCLIRNLNIYVKLIIFSLLFLSVGYLVLNTYGANYDPHPPMRLFPIFLSSTLLYPSDFSLRFGQFIGYIFFVYMSYRFAKDYFDNYISILFSAIIASMPLFINVASLVEQSIFSTLFFGYIVMNIIRKTLNREYEINYIRLFSLLAIAILLRQSSIIGFVPIMLMFLLDRYTKKDFSFLNLKTIYTFLPIIVFIPFFTKSLVFGTPATPSGAHIGILSNLMQAFKNGVVYNSMLNNLMHFTIFIFISLYTFKQSIRYGIVLLFFFATSLLIFYNTNSIIWGNNRYQLEIFFPLIFSGIFWFFYLIYTNKKMLNFMLMFIILNIFITMNLNLLNKSSDERKITYFNDVKLLGESIVLSEFTLPIDKALKDLDIDERQSVYIHGHTYGVFHQILHGHYSVSETMSSKSLIDELAIGWAGGSPIVAKKIHNNPNINIVLITTFAENDLIKNLKYFGWLEKKKYYDPYFRGTVYRLERKIRGMPEIRLDSEYEINQNIEKIKLENFNLELINNKPFDKTKDIVLVQDNYLKFEGWIFDNTFEIFNKIIFLLEDSNGKKYFIENYFSKERLDVASAFNNRQLKESGFLNSAKIDSLYNGVYKVSLLLFGTENKLYQYNLSFYIQIDK